MAAAVGVTTTASPPNAVVTVQPGIQVQPVVLVDQNGNFVLAASDVMTTLGDTIYENATPAPARLAGNTTSQVKFLSQTGNGTISAAPAWSVVSGQFLCTPTQYAPATAVTLNTSSATMAAVNVATTTVAAGSNGGEISQIATWSSPSAGVLDVATTTGWPTAGTVVVATSTTPGNVAYTGTAAGQLTGCTYISGSATGTVATAGNVTLTSVSINTGSFTAPPSQTVLVTVSGLALLPSAAANLAFGLAAHGTVTPMLANNVIYVFSANTHQLWTIQFLVAGLSGANNLDLLWATASGNVSLTALGNTSTTPTGSLGAPIIIAVQAV